MFYLLLIFKKYLPQDFKKIDSFLKISVLLKNNIQPLKTFSSSCELALNY